jgi:tetratricopeptide (TPR) repeat protein
MLASLIDFSLDHPLRSIVTLLFSVFTLWMLVDAARRGEWLWVVFIFICAPLNAPLYFFLVYRNSASFATRGFELPGTWDRRRIKKLEAQIYHLDKAHHYLELGDIYFHQGKLEKALPCYQKALERDPEDQDIRGHLGQCLLRLNKPLEARPLLEQVCARDPKHDYGHSLMALAEVYKALNETDAAIQTWQRVLHDHNYARARVQLAELYTANQQNDRAQAELKEVIADDANAPGFQQKRDRVWIKRARKLLRSLGGSAA